MPEQYAGLNKILNDLNKVDKPVLSEEQFEVINDTIKEALRTKRYVYLTLKTPDSQLRHHPHPVYLKIILCMRIAII
ncbi:YolD-like family protein [Priestia megaterium]|uniref:YolD-like family protein n=1 Tax=Priestia megaterium TaxID=1404 RepID=UPI003458E2AC